MYARRYTGKVKLAVLDTAGTFCDGPQDLRHRWPEDDLRGCKAPVVPFYEVLRRHNIVVDWATIRKPMGNFKPTHLRMLLELPEVKEQYLREVGHPCTEGEFDGLLGEFRPLMTRYIVDDDLSKPIEGALECMRKLREAGILVGCDTGYFDADSKLLNGKLEEKYGMRFDVATNSELVPGRPSPFMVYDCMLKTRTDVIESVVKIDDTAAGMICGNNAGCWTIGLYASGSNDYDTLAAAKPDFLVPSVAYVPDVVFGQIEPRMRRGERPGQGILDVV
jgi:phosphonoacetaldehyde hydrolase